MEKYWPSKKNNALVLPVVSCSSAVNIQFSFTMRWFFVNYIQSDISEQCVENKFEDFYQVCPHCDTSCPDEPFCPSCHVNRIYAEEYTAAFGCHCWEKGPDFQHSCVDSPEGLPVPNWNSPAEELRRLRLTKCVPDVQRAASESLAKLAFPAEIQSIIFSYLDEMSVVNASRVNRRWESIIRSHFGDDLWRELLYQRWPLFQPYQDVQNWLTAYFQMLKSVACKPCFLNATGTQPVPNFNGQEGISRASRLEKEVIGLNMLKPKGLDAVPIDSARYNWIARVTGPVNSPYEGGIFYIKLSFPQKYPYQPPICQMVTKILHPNISRHGQVGLTILNNDLWTPCNTVRSILMAVYKLLSTVKCLPKDVICMEPDIEDLSCKNYSHFSFLAKKWTEKYAMHCERASY